jgi:hypothetical protein
MEEQVRAVKRPASRVRRCRLMMAVILVVPRIRTQDT